MKLSSTENHATSHANDAGTFHSTCFVCGHENAQGIRLQLRREGRSVKGEVLIDSRFEGYTDVVHGGVIASLLDAAMVHSVRGLCGKDPFTCRLDLRFYHETRTGQRLVVVGHVKSRRGKLCWAEGELFSGETRCAKAEGVFRLV
ncbi:MAG: PaaI family thioesterase [Bacteroidota bacterium]